MKLSNAALENMREVPCDFEADVEAIRNEIAMSGEAHARANLLSHLLSGADDDRRQGWLDYADAVMAAAATVARADAERLAKLLFDDDMGRADEVPIERDGSRAYDAWVRAAGQAGDEQTSSDLASVDRDAFAAAWDGLVAEGAAKKAYEVRYSNGRRVGQLQSYEAALAEVESSYPEMVAGHDGDLTDDGDRTLCWASEADSVDDDGARAVASIYEVKS
jgi:hypothetical protein